MSEELVVRFCQKIKKQKSGCWIWAGAKNSKGYGRINVNGVNRKAHHISLLIFRHRELLLGEHTDHLCMNRSCVNPSHLEVVSAKENRNRQTEKSPRYRGRSA